MSDLDTKIYSINEAAKIEQKAYNAGYKKAFEETLATVKYYADKWDGIYQAIDTLEEKWREKQREMESDKE